MSEEYAGHATEGRGISPNLELCQSCLCRLTERSTSQIDEVDPVDVNYSGCQAIKLDDIRRDRTSLIGASDYAKLYMST